MKKIPRRDKMKIYGDLLAILQAERKETEKIVLIHIQTKLNVPFDRLKSYLSDLESLGLIEDQVSYKLTLKGKQYLKEYRKIVDFMERMGISYK
ncbi:MAG: winged helix-turn-helix domain-containing protein [Candidatus Bathyarchaeia archaeon]|jgi:predicted transcriptional regulator